MEILIYEGQEYVSGSELARSVGVNRAAVYNAVREGRLPAVRVMGRTLIPLADAQAYQPTGRGGLRSGSGRPRKAKGGDE